MMKKKDRRRKHFTIAEDEGLGGQNDSTDGQREKLSAEDSGLPGIGGSGKNTALLLGAEDITENRIDSQERALRPLVRAAVPILTLLDDGSYLTGEAFRLRSDRFVIGRTAGDLILSHDKTVSGTHLEILRLEHRGRHRWVMRDLDAANGTFVRVAEAIIYDDTTILIGGGRYQLQQPLKKMRDSETHGTTVFSRETDNSFWPCLVCVSDDENSIVQYPIRTEKTTVGKVGGGSDIEIDDPHLAHRHATIDRLEDGNYRIVAHKSLNGVWANVRVQNLSRLTYFRCGECFFKFEFT